MMSLSENMRYLRTIDNLSVREAAEKLGCAPSSLLNWESGRISPPADAVQKMCKLYDVSADEIFGWENCRKIEAYMAKNQEIIKEIQHLKDQKVMIERRLKVLTERLNQRI